MSKAETIHDPTDAAAVVGEQMRGRLGDLVDRFNLVDAGRGDEETRVSDERAAEILGRHADDIAAMPSVEVADEAEQTVWEYPLCVESTTTFEIVLGTGGPADSLLVECEAERGLGDAEQVIGYSIRRVLYRFSWSGSAEIELHGEDREIAERFARQVVPELVE